ncbi:MAG: hypothetical protein AB2813_07230 [Candidatus Sedimenticola endophacoides]
MGVDVRVNFSPTTTLTLTAISLIALTWGAYHPGLGGGFLFDDFANLPPLGEYGGVTDTTTLRLYLESGFSGPTKRPLSLLSFLLDAQDWPADPYPFLRTNILLHIINGLLVLWLCIKVIRSYIGQQLTNRVILTATAATLPWVLNPFLVSTTLYIVQRMTQLSTLFALLGLILYLTGRETLRQRPARAYALMSVGLAGGTLLATFSKENGALLPLLVLTIDWIIYGRETAPKPNKTWMTLFLYIPSSAFLVYTITHWSTILTRYESRSFDLEQRIATEGIILWDYIAHLFIPRIQSRGLFHDSYPVADGILSSPWSVIGLLALACLILVLIKIRKRNGLISAAGLFFLSGHLMESTVLPLELYFEHRNYLPSALLFLPIAQGITSLRPRLAWVIAIAWITLITSITFQRASLWGDQPLLILTWSEINPDSIRTQIVATNELQRLNRPSMALALINGAVSKKPGAISLHLRRLLLRLEYNSRSESEWEELLHLIETQTAPFPVYKVLTLFERMVGISAQQQQGAYSKEDILHLLKTLNNRQGSGPGTGDDHLLQHLIGTLEISRGDFKAANIAFIRSLESRPQAEAGMAQAGALAEAGAFHQATALLNYIEQTVLEKKMDKKEYYLQEIRRFRTMIDRDMKIRSENDE